MKNLQNGEFLKVGIFKMRNLPANMLSSGKFVKRNYNARLGCASLAKHFFRPLLTLSLEGLFAG